MDKNAYLIALIGFLVWMPGAMAVYWMSKRRGLKMAWGAWLPVLHVWTLGNIADHYRKTVLGKKSGFRWWLMLLTLIRKCLCLYVAVFALALVMLAAVSGLAALFLGVDDVTSSALQQDIERLNIWTWIVSGLFLLHRGIKIWVLYYIYRSCKPGFAPVATALSVLPLVPTVMLFLLRDQDSGLPAAESVPVEAVVIDGEVATDS